MNSRRGSVDRSDYRRDRRRSGCSQGDRPEEPMHLPYEDDRQCSPENPLGDEPDDIYGAFYRLIFAFVYAILSFILAPVIKSSKRPRRPYHRSSGERPNDYHGHDRHSEYDHIEEGYARPRYEEPDSRTSHIRSVDTPSRKVVQFTPQRKPHRPPLGRIDLAKNSSSASVSSNSTASTSSSSESSRSGGFGHSSPSYGVHRSLDRILAASTPRTSHSSYFVGKY